MTLERQPPEPTAPLARPAIVAPWARTGIGHADPVRHWQTLVDRGLIGTPSPTPPAIAANRAATDALFRAIAADSRTLARGYAQ